MSNNYIENWLTYNTKKNRDFIQKFIPSVKQLLPIYPFLDDGSSPIAALSKEKNTWLRDLNDNFSINTVNGINIQLYAGNNKNTIYSFKIGNPNDLYVDGVPNSAELYPIGDGTILAERASFFAHLFEPMQTASHVSLIDTYNGDIIKFIMGTTAQAAPKLAMNTLSAPVSQSTSSYTLSLTVMGRVSPYITDPLGNTSGINPSTKFSENNIPNGQVAIDLEFGSISIASAANGVYTLTLSGSVSEDYWLLLSYFDGTTALSQQYHGFSNATETSFTITVDSTSTSNLIVNRSPQPLSILQASAVNTGTLTTKLTWTASPEVEVTAYNIYSRLIDEPYLYKIGTSTGNTYNTGHSWALDSTVKARIYAVSAVKADGTESFLSNSATNDTNTTPPTISAFTIPATSNSLTVPVTTFTATDDIAVTGYILSETSAPPALSDSGWSSSQPGSYAFSEPGAHTLYAWAKDAAGNVSTSLSANVTIDITAPAMPIVYGPSPTNNSQPTWTWTSGGGGNGTFRYKLDNGDLTIGATETTATTFTPLIALSDGEHILYVQERNAAGTWSLTGSKAIVVFTAKPGDCDGDGKVSIAEVQSAINMYLGLKTVAPCVDTDGNGSVSIAEVQKVINGYLGL